MKRSNVEVTGDTDAGVTSVYGAVGSDEIDIRRRGAFNRGERSDTVTGGHSGRIEANDAGGIIDQERLRRCYQLGLGASTRVDICNFVQRRIWDFGRVSIPCPDNNRSSP